MHILFLEMDIYNLQLSGRCTFLEQRCYRLFDVTFYGVTLILEQGCYRLFDVTFYGVMLILEQGCNRFFLDVTLFLGGVDTCFRNVVTLFGVLHWGCGEVIHI